MYRYREVFVIWESLPSTVTLNACEVHLWRATLHCTDAQFTVFQQIISSAELAQAKKFIRENDQRKHVISRALTRQVLAHYLKISARDIEFRYGRHGKPSIKNQTLQFNISHSGDCFLLGVSYQTIGVDVEQKRVRCDYLALAQRFFTISEHQAIQNQNDFYRCWTCKEAFIKATGLGLSFGFSNFEVNAWSSSSEESALVGVYQDVELAKQWFLRSISLDESDNVFAACCVKNQSQKIMFKCFELN